MFYPFRRRRLAFRTVYSPSYRRYARRKVGYTSHAIGVARSRPSGMIQKGMPTVRSPLARWSRDACSFPAAQKFDCMFTDAYHTLTATAAGGVVGGEIVYRLNSIYDPYFGAGGGQPEHYVTLSNLYERYLVYWVEINVKAYVPGANTLMLHCCVQSPDTSYSLAGKTCEALTQDRTVSTLSLQTAAAPNGQVQWNSGRLYCSSLCGISKMMYVGSHTVYGAQFAANPTLSPWLRVAVSDAQGNAGNVATVQVSIRYGGRAFGKSQPLV